MQAAHGHRRRVKIGIVALLAAIAVGVAGYLLPPLKKAAPDVVFTSLRGERLSMRELRGKVVVVNFWATSCAACIREMPQLARTYLAYKDQGLELVAVAMRYDPPNHVLNYAQTRALPFTVALDPQGAIAQAFDDVRLTPTTYVIDKEGSIIWRHLGEPDFDALRRLLEAALAA